jgi:hypothetical protein
MARFSELRTRLKSLPKSFLRNDDGIMAIVFALCLPVFVVVAALAIDMGYSYWMRNKVQVDATASALAGAGIAMDDATLGIGDTITYTVIDSDPADGVPDDGVGPGEENGALILKEALAYALKNIDDGEVLDVSDVLPGHWDKDTRTFTRAGNWNPDQLTFNMDPATLDLDTMTWGAPNEVIMPLNAVMTTTRRAEDGPNDNPLPLFLGAAVGMPEININTTAIATFDGSGAEDLTGCITTLNRTDAATFYINGTADILAPGCNIDIYSDDACALRAVGTPDVDLSYIDAETGASEPGTIQTGTPLSAHGADDDGTCDTPNVEFLPSDPTGGLDVPDEGEFPFSYLYPPGGTCLDGNYCDLVTVTGTEDPDPGLRVEGCPEGAPPLTFHAEDFDEDGLLVLGAGKGPFDPPTVYCGGIEVYGPEGSTVQFDGNFVISGGVFQVRAQVAMTSGPEGMGVYLMDGAQINLAGGAGGDVGGVGLTATTEGPLKNFIFFEDPNSFLTGNDEHFLRGTALGGYDGIIFTQNSDVQLRGTADMLNVGATGDCTAVISDEIEFRGTVTFGADLSGCGGLPPASLGSLVLRVRN